MSQSTPTKHDGCAVLVAVAELLVLVCSPIKMFNPRENYGAQKRKE